ncbi:MAG: glycosyltransferase [Beutenbergiaceae bacterium]
MLGSLKRRSIESLRLLSHRIPARLRTFLLAISWYLSGAPRVQQQRPGVTGGSTRLLIAPANFAGQGYAWSRAVRAQGVASICVEVGSGTLAMPTDYRVPAAAVRGDRRWAREQFAWVSENFTHVLAEASRPLFGPLFDRNPLAEIRSLQQAGLTVAILAHGTDIRVPSAHAAREPWSPFHTDIGDLALRELRARAGLGFFSDFDGTRFVSTPDLLEDLPQATWCPVVVDYDRWADLEPVPEQASVLHVPSKASIKGSELVDPLLRELAQAGTIQYQRAAGVPAADMPGLVSQADIVIDQFRIGNYGVAACEAMAAGRVVVSYVRTSVRDSVRELTGFDLPIVQASAADVANVVTELVHDPGRCAEIAAAGQRFVRAVHDGRWSSRVLMSWMQSQG